MRVDASAWTVGTVLIWIGVAMAFDFDNEVKGLNLMVIGGILLLGALVARASRSDDRGGLLIAGLVVGLIGLDAYLESQGTDLPIGAIIVIVIGVLILGSAMRGKRPGPRIFVGGHHHRHDPPEERA